MRCRSRSPRRIVLGAALFVLAGAGGAAAEVAVAVEGGYLDLTNARDSASAVFGSAGGLVLGGQVRFDLGERFFAGAGLRFFQREGERVFVAGPDAPVFGLGHPLEVRLVPIYGTIGYRFRPGAKLAPYLALEAGATSYREESEVGGLTEEESQTKASGRLAGGIEYGTGTVRFGLELGYSLVPNTIGVGGVSAVYGEDDLGGFSASARVLFVP